MRPVGLAVKGQRQRMLERASVGRRAREEASRRIHCKQIKGTLDLIDFYYSLIVFSVQATHWMTASVAEPHKSLIVEYFILSVQNRASSLVVLLFFVLSLPIELPIGILCHRV